MNMHAWDGGVAIDVIYDCIILFNLLYTYAYQCNNMPLVKCIALRLNIMSWHTYTSYIQYIALL